MLFALEDPSQAQCITFYDDPNAEVAIAAALARAAGATHHLWPRDPEHYALGAEETVRITGGMWSIMSGHYTPFLDRVAALGCGTWLTACYADYLFKGLAFNRAHRQLLGRNLPLKRLDEFAFEFYMPHHRLVAGYQKLVRQRLEQHLAGIETTDYARSALPVEERRLRPASREADAAGRLSLQRAGSCDWVFSDNDVLDVYGRLSVASKLNGIVFERAVARICGPATASIRNNNYGTRLGASDWQRSLQFVAASLGRKVRRRLGRPDLGLGDGLASAGSWPNWHYLVAHSQGFAELWSQPSAAERAFFGQFLGHDPWQKSMQQWGAEPFLFCQLLTVRLWLRQRRLL
jgi:asparagine synthase (glutamine-hydrolysing)